MYGMMFVHSDPITTNYKNFLQLQCRPYTEIIQGEIKTFSADGVNIYSFTKWTIDKI